jgi:hypothetical protein
MDYERCLSVVRAKLPEDVFSIAWAEGQEMTIEDAVAFALSENAD